MRLPSQDDKHSLLGNNRCHNVRKFRALSRCTKVGALQKGELLDETASEGVILLIKPVAWTIMSCSM